jgi:isopentenyl-diphosphate delta-isomerase
MQARTVTLVDEENKALGEADILEAHTGDGMLHRAFSVYVMRDHGREILMQRRSEKKMLWSGIWANTACSHPFPDETATAAGERRLKEEMGFTVPLEERGTFVYRAVDPSGKGVEHEHVTLLQGSTDGLPVYVQANRDEVAEWTWIKVKELRKRMKSKPERFAPWFHQGLELLLATHVKKA